MLSLPTVLPPDEAEVPLFTGNIEEAVRQMNGRTAGELSGGLAYPGKMDVPSWGISAARCRIGSALARREGSVCEDCYARKGTFQFRNVQAKLDRAYDALIDTRGLWAPAMVAMIRWHCEERFRWFHSGDLQGINHLRNIIQICLATPWVMHWMPTREGAVLKGSNGEIPKNLLPRLSASMVDGPPPRWWEWTSTVVTEATEDICPSSLEGGSCADHDCTECWKPERKNVPYLKH